MITGDAPVSEHFDKYERYGAIHWRETNPLALRYNPALTSRYRSVLKHLPCSTNSVLDIGCGDGRLTYLIAKKLPAASVLGIDTEHQGIEIATQRAQASNLKHLTFEHHGQRRLQIDDRAFDLVVMTDVIEHLPYPDDMLADIARVLTPDGSAIITTPNRQDGSKWDVRHIREFNASELEALSLKHFRKVDVYGSWPMDLYRRGKTIPGRVLLNLTSRIGVDLLGREVIEPGEDYGQLLAVCKGPR